MTVALLLAELLGLEEYGDRVKIYATDVDQHALAAARQAEFSRREIEGVPPELRERYFERSDQRYTLRQELRRTLIFGRNNLIDDAPISRLDLLVCRNTLIYFNAETQERILRHLHFALRPTGVLLLGKSETLIAHRDHFATLDLKHRIFRPAPQAPTLQSRITAMTAPEAVAVADGDEDRAAREAALDVGPEAQILISRSGRLTFANVGARALLGIADDGLGSPFSEHPVASDPSSFRTRSPRPSASAGASPSGRSSSGPRKVSHGA